eukprot:Rmarinus@m.9320
MLPVIRLTLLLARVRPGLTLFQGTPAPLLALPPVPLLLEPNVCETKILLPAAIVQHLLNLCRVSPADEVQLEGYLTAATPRTMGSCKMDVLLSLTMTVKTPATLPGAHLALAPQRPGPARPLPLTLRGLVAVVAEDRTTPKESFVLNRQQLLRLCTIPMITVPPITPFVSPQAHNQVPHITPPLHATQRSVSEVVTIPPTEASPTVFSGIANLITIGVEGNNHLVDT